MINRATQGEAGAETHKHLAGEIVRKRDAQVRARPAEEPLPILEGALVQEASLEPDVNPSFLCLEENAQFR